MSLPSMSHTMIHMKPMSLASARSCAHDKSLEFFCLRPQDITEASLKDINLHCCTLQGLSQETIRSAGNPTPAPSQGQRASELEHLELRVAAVLERPLKRPLRLVLSLVAADGLHHRRGPAHLYAALIVLRSL